MAHPRAELDSQDLSRRVLKLTSILDVAKAMTLERDLETLLPLILHEAAKVVEADRCSLFILDRERNELWTKLAQGSTKEIRLPLGSGIAGVVAQTGSVINSPDAYADPRFNRTFDLASGYRTRNLLCVPMRGANGGVTGVLQALNKRGGAFDDEDVELLLALGAQAAASIENALLHEEISQLFEGFVSASVVAIESRDPTTAGHSSRVASLSVGLARALEHVNTGPHAHTRYTPVELQELRYASLLHDFGKVGVREAVLVKAEKLYPEELAILQARFQVARKDVQLQSYRRRLDAVAVRGHAALAEIHAEEEARLTEELGRLDGAMEFVLTCNKPTVLAQGGFERLAELGERTFEDAHGAVQPLLLASELQSLSITRGTLSALERKEIESHVDHTYRFLKQIPWTRALRGVPEIAYAHLERMDGTGYPRCIPERTIPVQSRVMAIADIYDALTASDRPYKKAVPHVLALDILGKEATRGQLDAELLRIFVEADIPRLVR